MSPENIDTHQATWIYDFIYLPFGLADLLVNPEFWSARNSHCHGWWMDVADKFIKRPNILCFDPNRPSPLPSFRSQPL